MNRGIKVHQRKAAFLLIVFLAPFFSDMGGVGPIGSASAAIDDCGGDLSPIVWNETISRHAEVPFYNPWDWNDFGFEDDDGGRGGGKGRSAAQEDPVQDSTGSPEEPYMYMNYHSDTALDKFESNIATTIKVGNDSVGAIRVNLSSTHRTTICVEIQGLVGDQLVPAEADVYLMTTNNYDSYQGSYQRMHSSDMDRWFRQESSSSEEFVAESSPEWAAFEWTGWKTYRDVHAYDSTDSVVMSVSLDGPEVYSSLFSGTVYEEFFIVIDTWDNSHRGDAPVQDKVVVADISISTVERSIVLPNWTVSLAFLVFFMAIVMAPLIVNKRYMNAGLEQNITEEQQLMPSLQQNVQ
jgi:hypothetical protein